MSEEEEFERLTIPNGISVDDDALMTIELVYDGDIITFRGEDGVLMEMDLLCYLDYVSRSFNDALIDADTGESLHPLRITPGHVLCHLVQHLHMISHQFDTQPDMEALRAVFGKALDIEDGTPFNLLGAVFVGEDGVEKVLTADDLRRSGIKVEDSTEDPEEGEIIISRPPNDTRH